MSRGSSHIVRVMAVTALALAGATVAVRSAIVNQMVDERPALAAKVWPGHPQVQVALAMAGIGKAAAAGRAPDAETVALAMSVARRAPLAIEPFLIRGAIMQSEGRQDRAEPLLIEASRRDPRSAAARFLLAQRYLSTGRSTDGLREASVLGKLVQGGSSALVPALAQYAKSPNAVPALRKMFAVNPDMRDLVLAQLSLDADNYGTILSLAATPASSAKPAVAPLWQSQLLRALVERGDIARAHDLWLRVSGLRSAPVGLFNPQFAKLTAPAPFNWTFGSGEFGLAEPRGDNGLQIIYYGRTNAEFASQIVLLPPDTYRLSMKVARDPGSNEAGGLSWSIACQPGGKPLLTLPVGKEIGLRTISGQFTVPADCRSQLIKLGGVAGEFASSEQVTISNLQLAHLTK